jgi:alpha-D-xyloside xylohydrolase
MANEGSAGTAAGYQDGALGRVESRPAIWQAGGVQRRLWMGALAVGLGGLGCRGGGDATPDTEGGSTGPASTGAVTSGASDGVDETGSGESSGGPTGPAEFDVACTDAGLALTRDGEPLLDFSADAFQIGVVDAIDDSLSYDPVADLAVTWRVPTRVSCDAAGPTLTLTYEGGATGTVAVQSAADGRWAAQWTTSGATVAVHRLRAHADATEGFYGLGEMFDTPEHRGKLRALQLEADLGAEGASNEAHVPVPLLVGTRGWGLFVEDRHPMTFAVATEAADLVEVTVGSGPAGVDGLALHLYAAEHPLDVTAHYHATTAWPILPAPWALGPWIWRNENDDQAQVIDDANTMRTLDLPTSALWIDRPYATGVNTFDFDPMRYPDPQGMIDTLHDLGFRVGLWHTPYVSNMAEPAPTLYDEALASGFFPPVTGLVLNNWGDPIDFTNGAAYDWWQGNIAAYTDMGIEGFKLDYGEDILAGLGPARIEWAFADGSDDRTMHNAYQLAYHEVYAQMLPPDGGFLLARAGTYGDQANVSVIWPGDLDATMYEAEARVDGESHVGGLPAAVVAGLSLGPSGYPCFASDTGGYRHSPPNKETFTRWFQHTALTVVMQIGTGGSNVAWEQTPQNGFDDEMLGWYRDFTRLHLRLFPYLWTHLQRVGTDGRPIVRALGLAHPELGVHPSDVYLLGDDLLVAPVVEEGATTRTLTVPPGTWVGWFTGDVVEGGGEITVDAPLSALPLWLRAGAIVPLLRPTIDTLSPTTDASVDSFVGDAGILYPRVVPGPASSFALYDGGTLSQADDGGALTLGVDPGDTFVDGVVFEVLATPSAPSSVTLDGNALAEAANVAALDDGPGWVHDGTTLWVRVPAGAHEVVATP